MNISATHIILVNFVDKDLTSSANNVMVSDSMVIQEL